MADGHKLLLFPHCVSSIVGATRHCGPSELVVADWDSDDWPLNKWLVEAAKPLPTRIVPAEGQFCRGLGRNIAARHARGDTLFFLDADCLISEAVISAGLRHIAEGASYFPVLYSYDSPQHENGWWRHEGYGNCIVTKQTLAAIGGWSEMPSWGGEDDNFFAKVASYTRVVREEVPGFYHQWHPETISWKDRYREDAEVQEVTQTLGELWNAVPQGETIILVDEAQCGGYEKGHGRKVVPFTENDGAYWGPPADDETAIEELERQRSRGARYIAFILGTSWWLDHYDQFRNYLETNYSLQLQSNRITLFSLR